MANQLIDQSSIGRSNSNEETTMPDKKTFTPSCWLYSESEPKGRIFEGDDIEKAMKDGWRDEPPGSGGVSAAEPEIPPPAFNETLPPTRKRRHK